MERNSPAIIDFEIKTIKSNGHLEYHFKIRCSKCGNIFFFSHLMDMLSYAEPVCPNCNTSYIISTYLVEKTYAEFYTKLSQEDCTLIDNKISEIIEELPQLEKFKVFAMYKGVNLGESIYMDLLSILSEAFFNLIARRKK